MIGSFSTLHAYITAVAAGHISSVPEQAASAHRHASFLTSVLTKNSLEDIRNTMLGAVPDAPSTAFLPRTPPSDRK